MLRDSPREWCSACCNQQNVEYSQWPSQGLCAETDLTPSSGAYSGTPEMQHQGTLETEMKIKRNTFVNKLKPSCVTWRCDLVTEGAHFIASFKISPQRAAKSFTMLCS